jgi:hypothetical protein
MWISKKTALKNKIVKEKENVDILKNSTKESNNKRKGES